MYKPTVTCVLQRRGFLCAGKLLLLARDLADLLPYWLSAVDQLFTVNHPSVGCFLAGNSGSFCFAQLTVEQQ